MLLFSTHSDQPEGQADVASTMEHTSVLLSSQLSKNRITLTQEFTHKRTLAITANRLLQLLMSLMQNAIHAILENGGEEREILVSTRETDEVVQISIRDTGCGIPQNQRSRIFEPFFTTKGPLGGGRYGCHRNRSFRRPRNRLILRRPSGTGRVRREKGKHLQADNSCLCRERK